jgi:hypothetical protein
MWKPEKRAALRVVASSLLCAGAILTAPCACKPSRPAPSPEVRTAPSLFTPTRAPEPTPTQSPATPTASGSTFTCGNGRCLAGTETCCQSNDVGTCVPNAPPDPPEPGQLLGAQISACEIALKTNGITALARCGGATNCANGELCCSEFLFGGATAIICKPAEPDQVSCDYGEVCDAEHPCGTPKAQCVNGQCRPSPWVKCGSVTCDMRTHSCYTIDEASGKMTCASHSEVGARRQEGLPALEVSCMSHADCLVGELCRTAFGQTFCERADNGMTGVLCDKTTDCPSDLCEWRAPGKKPVCRAGADYWHALCEC